MPEQEILVAEFERNSRELCRVRLTTFKGMELVDIRSFYQDAEGAWKPGKGIALRRDLLPTLIDALQKAEQDDKTLDAATNP